LSLVMGHPHGPEVFLRAYNYFDFKRFFLSEG